MKLTIQQIAEAGTVY